MEAHPVGDDEKRPQQAIPAAVKAMIVDTLGRRILRCHGIKSRQPLPLVSWCSLLSFWRSVACLMPE